MHESGDVAAAPTDRPGLRARLAPHKPFLVVLVLAVALRAMAVLVFRPGGYLGEMSDFSFYRLLIDFTNQGYYPLVHYWMEYPPIVPWIMVGLYRLSLLIPPAGEPGTWFYLLMSAVLVAADAGNLIALYAIGRRLSGTQRAVQLSWIYAVLLVPVLLPFGWFDGLALLFLLLAVLWTLERRPLAAGVAAGVGFMTKLVPIAALPGTLLYLDWKGQRVRAAAGALLSTLLLAAPFLALGPAYFLQSMKSPVLRSTWETLWAVLDGYYSYGIAGGWNRFDPAMAGGAQHPTRLPWLAITLVFIAGYVVLFVWAARAIKRAPAGEVDVDGEGQAPAWTPAVVDRPRPWRAVAFVALTQTLLTLYFKGYSPQFLVMLLPFILLLIPGWRALAYVLLLSAINLVEYPVYFLVLPEAHWLLGGTVLLRTLILIVVGLEYAGQVYAWRVRERTWSRVALGVAALTGVLALAAVVPGYRAYAQARYQASPHRAAMDALQAQAQPGATVIVAEQGAYEHLYPYLHRQFRLAEVETYDWLPAWEPRLAATTDASAGTVWLYAPAGSPLHAWMAGHYRPVADEALGDWRLTAWDKP
jgi:hypothetical protein